jgi:predicted NBD/HSP70 family sugar kinase
VRKSTATASTAEGTVSSGSPAVLRQLNSATVLDVIKRSPVPVRVAEIIQTTGLSRPTVETVTDGLLEQGWLELDHADKDGNRGRPARRFRFRSHAAYVIGLDIGAHSIAAVLADLLGTTVATIRRPVSPQSTAAARLKRTTLTLEALLGQANVAADKVLSMTVGTPGTVMPGQTRIGTSPSMHGWADVDIVDALRNTVDCPISIENDANLAALGEQAQGVAHQHTDVLFLLLGERLGAGVIAGGQLIRGRNGAAGELGYIKVAATTRPPVGYGPLESKVGAPAIAKLGRTAMRRSRNGFIATLCKGDPSAITAETVTMAAAMGDPAAIEVLRSVSDILAEGVAPALLTLNPQLLVLGGGVSQGGHVLRDLVAGALTQHVLYPPDVQVSALGDHAVLTGAVAQSLGIVNETVIARISA